MITTVSQVYACVSDNDEAECTCLFKFLIYVKVEQMFFVTQSDVFNVHVKDLR